jgi:hypothetical protein
LRRRPVLARSSGSGPQPNPSPQPPGGGGAPEPPPPPPPPPSSLDLPRESAAATTTTTAAAAAAPTQAAAAPAPATAPPQPQQPQPQPQAQTQAQQRAVKTTGLRRAPLSGGVKTATARYDLPSPAVAVRNLVEQARFAHLCTVMSHMHHRRAGYPFGTLVDFAVDGAGAPLFCLSPLAIHARNLVEDPRASLVVQMPGWTGLANARVTIFGDIYPLPPDLQDEAREIFLAKQQATGGSGSASSVSRRDRWVLGSFTFFRMHRITDVYFVGGFGTVQWIEAEEYVSSSPDPIATDAPQRTLQVLNEALGSELRSSLGVISLSALEGGSWDGAGADDPAPTPRAADRPQWRGGMDHGPDAAPEGAMPAAQGTSPSSSSSSPSSSASSSGAAMAGGLVGIDDAAFISIDALGTDVRVRHGSEFSVERIGFDRRVHTLDAALAAVRASLRRARREQAEATEVALRRAEELRRRQEAWDAERAASGRKGGPTGMRRP